MNKYLQSTPGLVIFAIVMKMICGSRSDEMNISSTKAMEIAQDFLDVVYPGAKADEILAYYGYYTVMTTKDGEHYGMVSVDSASGDIWYHT